MKTSYYKNLIIIIALLGLISCGNSKKPSKNISQNIVEKKQVFIPRFNSDSAYYFVKNQLTFGPRTPGSEAHAECLTYIESTLKQYTPNVEIQKFKARVFNGEIIEGKNIIASFQPEKKNRILLCAHWDSRPFADQDNDPSNHDKPLLGANDGASGVGVLMEIARHLKDHKTAPGIDIVFFDLEDSGSYGNNDSWALGSQYWSKNPHKINYRARYGILLDMVGGKDPVFTKEQTSMKYAPGIMDKVWKTAEKLGYKSYFQNTLTGGILDDHVAINEYLNIPTIDIIHYDDKNATGFFEHWHTLGDDLSSIDPISLGVVGQTVMTVIFEEK